MADDKQPQHLDPSQDPEDHETTHSHHVDETQAMPQAADAAEAADARLDEDAAETADAQPTDAVTEEVDPETRMLEQIAALKASESSTSTSGAESKQTAEEHSAAERASAETGSGENDDDISHTTRLYASPLSAEADTPREQPVRPLDPVPLTAAAGGSTTGPNDRAKTPRTKKRRWPWILVLLILLLGGAYVGAAFATQDSLPATLTVEGVDVSGMSAQEAAPRLEDAFAERAQREITVTVDEQEATFVPADSGYSYDVEATLDDLTELTFNPVEIWARLFGEAHVSAETSVEEDASAETIAGLTEQLSFDPTEGSVTYEGAELNYSQPINGFTVDDEALAELVAAEWLSEQTELTAPGDPEAPALSAEQWEEFVADTAQPLVDDNYTVTADDATTELAPAQLGAAAEVRLEGAAEQTAARQSPEDTEPTTDEPSESEDAEGVRPVLLLDGDALTDSLAQNNPAFESTNQDATVRLSGTAGSARPEVVPGSTGRGVDDEQLVEEIMTDLNGEQTRSITVDLNEVEPEITTEDAEAWDVNHVDAEFSTPYPPEDGPRTANLRIGADRVNGTVVMPGEEFNLDAILAPITEANGYVSSGVVESGVTTNAIGGGLSQIATMAYNAGFLGGMEIVEHKPHSRWFDRYPQGRESTYWEGQINVRWKNDTDAPVIVEMWLAGNEVHTRLWGSDYYDVSTSTSEPYNHTASPTIRNSDSECIAERGGREGFTVDVHRTKTPPSGEPIQETWRWAYSGWPTVICE